MTPDDFPPHKGSLTLTHNPHRDYYETIERYQEHRGDESYWVSNLERTRALATGELWVLQWYPDTPVGSCELWASSLAALLDEATGPGAE